MSSSRLISASSRMATVRAVAFSLVFAGLITGCSSSTSTNTTPANTSTFSATVNGSAYNPVTSHAIYSTLTEQTAITSTASTGESLGLSFNPGVSRPGTYQLGIADSATGLYVKTNPEANYGSTSGSVTVTSWTTAHIKGSFNFKAINANPPGDEVTVTNGTFDLDITKE